MSLTATTNLYDLLHNRVYQGIDYQHKLLHCLEEATLPLDPIYPKLIHEYAYSCLLGSVEKVPEESVETRLQQKGDAWTPCDILLTFYMLCYNDGIVALRTDPKYKGLPSWGTHPRHTAYTIFDVVRTVPLRAMLTFIEHHSGYDAIYPEFVSLTASLFPELLDVTSFLLREGREPAAISATKHPLADQNRIKKHIHALDHHHENPRAAILALSQLQRMQITNVQKHADTIIVTMLTSCLEMTTDPLVIDAFISLWECFHQWVPHQVWMATVNALLPPGTSVTFQDLIQSPVLLFQSDPRIFESSKLLPLWLLVMQCIRTSSRHRIWQRFHCEFPKPNVPLNNRNVIAFVNGQEASIIQLLLEKCKAVPNETEDTLNSRRKLICRFIHAVFLEDRDNLLIKAVHFQTYAIHLIPMMVDLVPSLFTMTNFLPELLRQPYIEKQVFGVLLGCHLCERYPLESTLALAEKCLLPRLFKIAVAPSSVEPDPHNPPQHCVPSEYLNQTLPGFVHLAHAFPFFADTIANVLLDIQNRLPPPATFFEQQGSGRITILLQLHKVLTDTVRQVKHEAAHATESNKPLELASRA
ncbi:integrator complex subunit 2 [Gongronella butleri]|nr:integrator complex subunit 2 [Gongronella butleri]